MGFVGGVLGLGVGILMVYVINENTLRQGVIIFAVTLA